MKILHGEIDAHPFPDEIIQPDDSLFIELENAAQIFTPDLRKDYAYAGIDVRNEAGAGDKMVSEMRCETGDASDH